MRTIYDVPLLNSREITSAKGAAWATGDSRRHDKLCGCTSGAAAASILLTTGL
jgi:hypothetical protein